MSYIYIKRRILIAYLIYVETYMHAVTVRVEHGPATPTRNRYNRQYIKAASQVRIRSQVNNCKKVHEQLHLGGWRLTASWQVYQSVVE
jgi:hypothetical protein